jgi:hypothetical protein
MSDFTVGYYTCWKEQETCLALQESARRGEQAVDVVFENGKLRVVYASEQKEKEESDE